MVRALRLPLVLALLAVAGGALAQSSTITLGVGGQQVLNVRGMSTVSVGNEDIVDVRTVGGQVLVIGLKPGSTTLMVWKTNGTRVSYLIVVRAQDPGEVTSEIQALLGEMEGISVRVVGDRIILDGQAYTTQDAARVQQVVELYPNVVSFVRVAPNAKKLLAQNLNAQFRAAGLPNVNANVIGSTIFLEGSVESEEDLKKAELVTTAFGERVENLLVVGIKRMILSEVQFVEIRRNSLDRLGIRYPTDITGSATAVVQLTRDLFPTNFLEVGSALSANANSDLSIGFQMNDGYGRLLAQPKLVCASGESAEFLAGGEIPIPLISQNQLSVEYKPYGIILKISPRADRNGNIQTVIEAEASEVDTSVAISIGGNASVPGFRTRRVKTNVTVRHGETIVLSGVFSHDEQKAVSKVPGIGHVPVLGELFKNRAFDSNKRELVIFVTPRIVNPDSDKIRTMIEDVKARYRQARGEVNFGLFD